MAGLSVLSPITITDTGVFTRASSATYLDKGTLLVTTAAIDAPRFNYDPVTLGVSLLTEGVGTNSLLHSEVFDNIAWIKAESAITANAVTAPDGLVTADKLTETAVTAEHTVSQSSTITANILYTYSVYVQAAERSVVQLRIVAANGTAGTVAGVFDLTAGTVVSAALVSGTATTISGAIGPSVNGRRRVSVSCTLSATTTSAALFIMPQITTSSSYLGVVGSGLHVWGAGSVNGALSSYIPTTTVAVTRAADSNLSIFLSNTTETDYPLWSSATSYTMGIRVIRLTTHRIYECATANTNKDPIDIINRVGSVIYWIDISPTNRWAMFDQEVSTQTAITSTLYVTLLPGYFNSVYLGKVDADTLGIVVKDAPNGNITYQYNGVLEGSAPADYYEYFFDRFKPLTDFIASGIDPYNLAEITLILTKITGQVKCGVIALGDLRPLGSTSYGAKVMPKTYSYIKQDEYGNNKIQRRKNTKDMKVDAFLDLSEANTVLEVITSLLDVPCVWVGAEGSSYTGLRVFGLGSGELSYDYPEHCMLSLTVQGLI